MARVFLGRDTRLNRPVAIKILHPHYGNDTQFLARFQHEAQVAANLHHPNVVDVYDVGQDADTHYIVMEYVEGSDLKQHILQQGALGAAEAVRIAAFVADALGAAHRVGLVHRDIKPQNIIVDASGRVKITDFGIAKSSLSTSNTETGVIFGTADYLSPEQASGQPATAASDIYALGVTLYEMLTGRLPFTGESAIAVAMQHIREEPAALRTINPRIPASLEALVLQAMNKRPEDRPASADSFARSLRAVLQNGAQDTLNAPMRPATPRQQRPSQPRTAGETRALTPNAANGRTHLPPPRRVTTPPPRSSGGFDVGGVLVGLLLLIGVAGVLVVLFNGWLEGLLPGIGTGTNGSGTIGQPTRPTVVATAAPTAAPTALPLVSVPPLVGLTLNDALALLDQSGIAAIDGGSETSATVQQGLIARQEPPAGAFVSPITGTVTYYTSSGTGLVSVLDVTNVTANAARRQLEQLGLVVQVQVINSQVDEGFVVRQSPSPGLRVESGSTVTLFVSDGNLVTMPDVTGLDEAEARRQIAAAGLNWSFSDFQDCDKLGELCLRFAPNQVVSSIPRGGDRVPRGANVTLGVRSP